jgi:hypothetical protein
MEWEGEEGPGLAAMMYGLDRGMMVGKNGRRRQLALGGWWLC